MTYDYNEMMYWTLRERISRDSSIVHDKWNDYKKAGTYGTDEDIARLCAISEPSNQPYNPKRYTDDYSTHIYIADAIKLTDDYAVFDGYLMQDKDNAPYTKSYAVIMVRRHDMLAKFFYTIEAFKQLGWFNERTGLVHIDLRDNKAGVLFNADAVTASFDIYDGPYRCDGESDGPHDGSPDAVHDIIKEGYLAWSVVRPIDDSSISKARHIDGMEYGLDDDCPSFGYDVFPVSSNEQTIVFDGDIIGVNDSHAFAYQRTCPLNTNEYGPAVGMACVTMETSIDVDDGMIDAVISVKVKARFTEERLKQIDAWADDDMVVLVNDVDYLEKHGNVCEADMHMAGKAFFYRDK